MNFAILRSNHWRSPDPRVYNFHDPDWGIGDMMTHKVQKMLYNRAKTVKPYCFVPRPPVDRIKADDLFWGEHIHLLKD